MPFYDYACDNCDHSINVLQKRSDPGPGACSKCGQGTMTRQISGCSFALSGTGWYKDGYGTKAAEKVES